LTTKLTKRLIQSAKSKLRLVDNSRYQFFDVGFHGDKYLLALAYVARTYPQVTCISCEPDEKAFGLAVKHTKNLPNVTIYNATSQEFTEQLSLKAEQFFERTVLFWLDAHGYGFEWPLKEELAFITTVFKRGYILIDDFRVPGQDQFTYHQYDGQVCSFNYVQKALNPNVAYKLYYPDYDECTSRHHPLMGWGLLMFGDSTAFDISDINELKIKHG